MKIRHNCVDAVVYGTDTCQVYLNSGVMLTVDVDVAIAIVNNLEGDYNEAYVDRS